MKEVAEDILSSHRWQGFKLLAINSRKWALAINLAFEKIKSNQLSATIVEWKSMSLLLFIIRPIKISLYKRSLKFMLKAPRSFGKGQSSFRLKQLDNRRLKES